MRVIDREEVTSRLTGHEPGESDSVELGSLMESGYRGLGYLLLTLPLIVVAGFWIPYFSQLPRFAPSLTPPVHVHAALLLTWVALLVIQPIAIRRRAFSLHRLLGKVSYFLMPLIVIFSAAMLRKEYLENLTGGMPIYAARKAEFLSSVQLLLLTMFYFLAIVRIRQHDVAQHMRYMICIALALLPAGLARTLGYWFSVSQSLSQAICLGVIDCCLIALIVYDCRRHLTGRPYLVALAAYAISEATWIALGRPV